jgi:type II secretory pathway pseudopilin PulG
MKKLNRSPDSRAGVLEATTPRRRSQAGVTALELLVGLVVFGITMAATVPAFSHLMQSNNLRGSSEKMAGHFRLARTKAVSSGIPHMVIWSTSSDLHVILQDDNGNSLPDIGEPFDGPFSLPKNINLQNPSPDGFSNDWVTFTTDGSASEAGTLVVSNLDGISVNLMLLAPTGQVRLD